MAEKDSNSRQSDREMLEGGLSTVVLTTQQCCGRCEKPGHNVRTCPLVKESSDEDSEMDSD